jgi:hypothetical protein
MINHKTKQTNMPRPLKKLLVILLLTLQQIFASAQGQVDPSKCFKAPLIPRVHINDVDQVRVIKRDSLLKYGLQVVVEDKTFKVIQFDVMYDCHSRAVLDFTSRRYIGDKVLPTEKSLRGLVMAGDIIDVYNAIIEKDGYKYVMKTATYSIIQ